MCYTEALCRRLVAFWAAFMHGAANSATGRIHAQKSITNVFGLDANRALSACFSASLKNRDH